VHFLKWKETENVCTRKKFLRKFWK